MKPNTIARYLCLACTISLTLLISSCGNEDPGTDDPILENVGTLITNSEDFTHFASLIAVADQEIPQGEQGIMQILTDILSDDELTIFAPTNAVFETIAFEWSTSNFQVSIEEVIAEFTHDGQPAKTRDFILGHIFKGDVRYRSAEFQNDLVLESQKGIRWRMIANETANSGFGFVLESSQNDTNPYLIYQTDVLTGRNGVVHAALVN